VDPAIDENEFLGRLTGSITVCSLSGYCARDRSSEHGRDRGGPGRTEQLAA
jgi:hypothetical protein